MDTTPITKKEDITFKKEFLTNWRSFQKYNESPLETYFRETDLTYRNSTDSDYFERALQYEDPVYMGRLLTADWRFRNDAKLNIVASISDVVQRTGSGKTSAGLRFDLTIAKIFGPVFDLSHLCWSQDELDQKLENAENKTVWHLDEQLRKNVGLMSQTTTESLLDIEDTQRAAQICIIYCAPQLRSHNHFFYFETYKMKRINNPACVSCKPLNCAECKIPFYERSGYPEYIYLMFKTKRLTTGLPVPRGLIRVTMPPPELMAEYWKAKDINVQRIKKKEENAWQQFEDFAKKVFEQYKDSLVSKKAKGGWAIANTRRITLAIYAVKGMRYLTKDVQDLVIEKIKMLLENYVSQKDADDEFETENKEDEEEKEVDEG